MSLSIIRNLILAVLGVYFLSAAPPSAQSEPLRAFILAGQSNMEGHAKIESFDYIGDDPATAPLLNPMRDADGNRSRNPRRVSLI